MNLNKSFYLLILLAAILPLSCDQDFLNTEPLDKISSEATWADGPLSEAFIFNVYSYLGYGGFEEEGLAAVTDEAMFTHAGRGIDVITEGSISPSNLGNQRVHPQWGELYLAIRQANIAIERLPTSTFDNDELRDRLLGEAYFLRAYYYHNLVRMYGGVPIIDRTYGLGEDYSIARNTYEECVNFIISDLDQSARLLEGKPETPGRASALTAKALKARQLLYAASDLHHGPTATANSSVLAGYSDLSLVAYPGGDRNARWQAAQNAAKEVLDEGMGYKLDLTAPVSAQEGTDNYIALSAGGESAVADAAAAVELIFQRTHTALYTQENNWPLGGINWGINNGPNGYHNWAGNTPIQQLVDDYEMMDGSTFDWSNPTHAADPYANRDPRFYATIMYDGATWKPRPSDVAGLDPVDQIQTGYYDDGNGGTINGVDTRESSIENWNGSRTHYYVRKFIDPNPALPDNQSAAQTIPWPFIRYTEVVLNYVEASIELGDEAEARDWLNRIRYRVGMPAIDDTGDALRERYRNERRIELVYEEHRYYDGRRWMIGEELGRGIQTIDIRASLKPGATPHVPYRHDKSVYDYTYTVVENTENETRVWLDKLYFRPIDRGEMQRNELLVQNPGYAN
ncbi:RagB/SusD family nutrient uptake outer membrane protein [Flavilitoribacter nigricans]|uniref:RagB/SusD family nutrient uptake outer membrane protein n=1 Tax=Flavilitoribacter nigricans (strain ATCC 23147 / DSM 23189 / NBRC 102662 / NCIMB 1420 / SS-2) TaxID=1122177 RepID=A0A2D0MYV8_FLAN2|nr:RagB/SusD family nutrient uptake outer membrane protein [Flavilitoribacter nigricans]PHN01461.1 RagB/SusD family nutrient uptake outer membrane protein [Flavilitoribacter nigricans DSM 23189 = NBRC 102662]